ncbi:MAG: membrane dipeptidase, partial [Clostridia bacterium]|nr:membrane dipeptidase [Clostridia bacterium]
DMLDRLRDNGCVIGINYNHPFVSVEDRLVTISDLVDHVSYVRDRIGPEYVGFGSDFDGISNEKLELKDASGMPAVLEEMRKRGFSDREIDLIAGENVLRVFKANFGS